MGYEAPDMEGPMHWKDLCKCSEPRAKKRKVFDDLKRIRPDHLSRGVIFREIKEPTYDCIEPNPRSPEHSQPKDDRRSLGKPAPLVWILEKKNDQAEGRQQ